VKQKGRLPLLSTTIAETEDGVPGDPKLSSRTWKVLSTGVEKESEGSY
jgi:hypothetical protein